MSPDSAASHAAKATGDRGIALKFAGSPHRTAMLAACLATKALFVGGPWCHIWRRQRRRRFKSRS